MPDDHPVPTFRGRAGRALSDRRRHPRCDRQRRCARKATGQRRAARKAHIRERVRHRAGAASWRRRVARAPPGRALEEIAGVTLGCGSLDARLSRAREHHRLHLTRTLMESLLDADRRTRGPARALRRRARRSSPRRCASTSSTRSARSAGTSAPTSAPASWPSRCTRCSTRPATRSSGTSATRPTRTRSSPGAVTSWRRSASTAAWRRSARSPSPRTTSWAPATPRPRSATRSGSRRGCASWIPTRTPRSWR